MNERDLEGEREKEIEIVCIDVLMCGRERERERFLLPVTSFCRTFSGTRAPLAAAVTAGLSKLCGAGKVGV